ncbi:MAG: hypothetical protein AAGA29_14070 [Planctomycetota bacterium]
MPRIRRHAIFGFFALTALLLVGCANINPYLSGYSGTSLEPLDEEADVRVFGANREDPLAMKVFEFAHQDAMADHTLLGTSTIVSARSLRDRTAAQAARELGANVVLYNYAYRTTTVETHTSTHYHRHEHGDRDDDDHHVHYVPHHTRTDRTRHWHEYRAYFFVAGESLRQSTDSPPLP